MKLYNKKAQSSGLTWFFALIIIIFILILFVVSFSGLFISKGFSGVGNILGTKTSVLSADSFFLSGLQGQRMLFYFLNSPLIFDRSILVREFLTNENSAKTISTSGFDKHVNSFFHGVFYRNISYDLFIGFDTSKKLFQFFDSYCDGKATISSSSFSGKIESLSDFPQSWYGYAYPSSGAASSIVLATSAGSNLLSNSLYNGYTFILLSSGGKVIVDLSYYPRGGFKAGGKCL